MLLSTLALTATSAATGTAAGTDMLSSYLMIGFLILVFVAMYFITIRPQRKRDKELKSQIGKMAVGDTVVTIGGVVGVVANIKDDEVTITTSVAHTMITFKKSSINNIVPRV
jgi:preprotein translocase subunit YajC